jgi:PhnB protein
MKPVNHQPASYHTVVPYLTVKEAPHFIEFLQQVFDAKESERIPTPDGKIMHAEVRIGDSAIMISEACDEMGPMPASLYLYVKDSDAAFRKALDAGAAVIMEPADMFWGDRFSSVKDRWGNQWSLATHIEDVPREELPQRARAFMEQSAPTQS